MDKLIEKLTPSKLCQFVPFAKDLAAINGLLITTENLEANIHAPITLLPSPFPKIYYDQATALALDMNLLFHKVACDYNFLESTLAEASKVDDFLNNLWNIYLKTKDDCYQKVFLGLNRSDYMIDTSGSPSSSCLENSSLKQIEINLAATSMAGHAEKLTEHHRKLLSILGLSNEELLKHTVTNPCSQGLGRGLAEAWRHYGSPVACVLFVVVEKERNVFDQRALEYELYKSVGEVVVLRRTFAQLRNDVRLEGPQRKLFVGNVEVAVVYFRAGYVPEHFAVEDWQTRFLLEQSFAIKCPCISYALANTKLVQQALCNPGRVEFYLGDGTEASARMRSVFASQYLLTDSKAVEDARANPHTFVLKPQREGGGNNFYDAELLEKLNSLVGTPDELAFVLMRRLRPFSFQNYCLAARNLQMPTLLTMVTEFSVYGVILASEDAVHVNFEAGHLMRSKNENAIEGGVTVGVSFLDTPYLI